MYRNFLKPFFDFSFSLAGLLLASPVFIGITLVLFIANQGKPFFIQPRPGKNGKVFKLIKFRTMNDRRGPDGNLLPDADRLTRTGRFIRRTSLDEIPQLINVLKGDMSLVGPRPLLVEYLPLYSLEHARRHEVKPGITGWAQVNGRNAINWDKKFELDVWYVDHFSAGLDIRIVVMTVLNVLKGKGISQEGHVTMEKFSGSK